MMRIARVHGADRWRATLLGGCLLVCAAWTHSVAASDQAAGDLVRALQQAERIRRASGEVGALLRHAAPRISAVRWSTDDRFWYAVETANDIGLYLVDARLRRKTRVGQLSDLARTLEQQTQIRVDPLSVDVNHVAYVESASAIELTYRDRTYRYHLDTRTVTSADYRGAKAGHAVSPDGQYSVFVRGDDLYGEDVEGAVRRLSKDGQPWYSFAGHAARSNPLDIEVPGEAPRVHWIGGHSFYIERWDHREVGDLWLIDSRAQPRPRLIRQKMAFPGEEQLPIPEVWVFDARTGAALKIASDGWPYLGNLDVDGGGIFPSRDRMRLYLARLSRDFRKVELCAVDLGTGKLRVLLREQRDGYFTLRHAEFKELDAGFIWKSDRDGYAHYYLYDWAGRLVRQVSRGAFSVDAILRVDEGSGEILFRGFGDASTGNPRHTHLYRGRLDRTEVHRIDREEASHSPTVSPSGSYIVDVFSTVSTAPQMVLRDARGEILMTLETGSDRVLEQAGWKMPVAFRVMGADARTPLFGVMWLPFDFNAGRRYPVIVQVYPGPASENVPATFTPAGEAAALAQLGFVVIRVGQRGSASHRGVAYQSYARALRNVRDYALEDNRAALEQLAKRHRFIDLTRVGILGHSGGGFMAAAAMLQYPELYKVGVAASGNHDNNIYELNSSEFYFGDPKTHDAGAAPRYATNADVASRLTGRLLLIHGDVDDDVNPAHTLRLVRALIDAGKDFDLLVVPGMAHAFPETLQPYIWAKIGRHFLTHLAEASHPAASSDQIDLLPQRVN